MLVEERALPAPDGGWGWVVVLGCSCMHLFVAGLERSFGLLYLELLDKFNQSSALTGWIGPLQSSLRLCLGVAVSLLAARFGARPVASIGAVLFASGIGFSGLAPFVWVHIFTYSVLGGVGVACCYSPPFALIGQYFDKRRSLANGLATAGSGIGSFSIPLLVSFMLRSYGLEGTLFLLAAINLHLLPCGLLYLGLQSQVELQSKSEEKQTESPLLSEEQSEINQESCVHRKTESCQKSSTFLAPNKSIPCADEVDESDLPSHQCHLHSASADRLPSTAAVSAAYLALSRTSLAHPSQGTNLTQRRKHCDWSMLRNRNFMFFNVTCFFVFIGAMVFLTLLPAAAVEKGVNRGTSAFILSTFGACDFCGRISFGILLDRKCIRNYRLLVFRLAGVVAGICTLLVPVCTVSWQFFVIAGIFGAMNGCLVSQRPVIALDMAGSSRLGPAFGVITFFQGLGFLVSLPIAGAFRDNTGDYQVSFLFCGASFLLGAGIGLLERLITCLHAKRSRSNSAND